MIFKLSPSEFEDLLNVVNNAAQAYKGIITEDRWKEPYMSTEELENEIESGVEFYGWKEDDVLAGAIGIQFARSVTLIRHAYVRTSHQRRGIGKRLLRHLMSLAQTPWILVGTWEAAHWAVRSTRSSGLDGYLKERKTHFSETSGTFLKDRFKLRLCSNLRYGANFRGYEISSL